MGNHNGIGIVTTLRDPGRALEPFLSYHLALGFDRFYLFFDDPHDPALPFARRFPQVTTIPNDAHLKEAQRRIAFYPELEPYLGEIISRQCLNVESGIQHALADGLEWLLHIDVDELFYTNEESAKSHFASHDRDIGGVIYHNLEAAPECFEIEDFFREVTLFKTNPASLNRRQFEAAFDTVERKYYFLGYENGKSAARVTPGLHAARGPHVFDFDDAHPDLLLFEEGTLILHYINCGYSQYRKKYEQLGNFPDRHLGQHPLLDFHQASRDTWLSGNDSALRELYRKHVQFSDPAEVERMIASGLLRRVTGPATRLAEIAVNS